MSHRSTVLCRTGRVVLVRLTKCIPGVVCVRLATREGASKLILA